MTTEVMKQEEQTRAMRARLPISTDGSQNMRQVISDTSQSHSCTWPGCTARPWVGLTKEEAADCWSNEALRTWHAIEAALKEKNT